jgi:hypothetical protein
MQVAPELHWIVPKKRAKIEPLVMVNVRLKAREIEFFKAYGNGDDGAGLRKFLDDFRPQIKEILERENRRGHN